MKRSIGVFDSGIGGLTVLKELIRELPNEDFIYFGDSKNAPYGSKSVEEIINFSIKMAEFLVKKNVKLIIIACNTATAAAVFELRKMFYIPIIGLEPAVKPACLSTKTGNIGVLATQGTFRGNHFKNTSEKYKDYVTIHLQVAKELVEFAEKGIFSGENVDYYIKKYITPFRENNVDYIVLGCTHYAFFNKILCEISGNNLTIIDSAKPVARRAKDILMTYRILENSHSEQNVSFYTSGNLDLMEFIIKDYLGINDPHIDLITI